MSILRLLNWFSVILLGQLSCRRDINAPKVRSCKANN